MNPYGRLLAKLLMDFLVPLLLAGVVLPIWAQEAQPAAGLLAPAAEKKPAVKKAPGPGEKLAAAKKPAEEQNTPAPDTPAVQAILANNPSTPTECVQAARVLADLGRPELSKQFLKRVLDAKPDETALADLGEQVGSATLLNMSDRKELLPEAKQLANAVLAAVNRRLHDPRRLAGLIGQLRDPSPQVRVGALKGLLEARGGAVGPLTAVLADPARAAEYPIVRAVLVRLESDAVEALLGMLEKPEPKTISQAIQVLVDMHAVKAAVYLLRPAISEKTDPEVRASAVAALGRLAGQVPGRKQAVHLLIERAENYFDRRQPVEREVAGQVELWDWDAAQRRCVARSYPVDDASRVLAARLARDAFALAPEDGQVRRVYLATMLEQAAYERGLDKPVGDRADSLPPEVERFGAAVIEDVLQYAMAGNHPAAATVAARILGRCGQTEELLYRGPQPGPLALATQNPERRLRLAACEAIVRLQPGRPYAGSSYVPQTLALLAASGGMRRALVAGPSVQAARELGGMMAASGLQADTATSGRELLRMAVASPDYELALIDPAIEQPTIDLLLQELRGDWRSADLRVGLIARSGCFEQAERLARGDPLTLAFARPHDQQSLQWQLAQLAALRPREFVGYAERQRQAAAALDLLAELGSSPPEVYDLRRIQDSVVAALYTPALSTKAVGVLAHLGTPESQRALVDLASRFTQPLEIRRAAVVAFRRNSQKQGLLLTTAEIRRQYDRYNQSESLDAATQRILGLILDCIEAPTQPVKSK
jgi:hypothetical protein